jgi:hypothetical protein
MHEAMRELAVRGEQQEARRVEVQTPDRNPPSSRRLWQPLEYRRSPLGIPARRELPARLVIREIAVRTAVRTELDGTAIEQDPFLAGERLAELGTAAVYDDATFGDPTLDLAP